MKYYGSLQNRMMEDKDFCKEIKVGMGMTEYMYSDRHAYEVVEVKDQKHVTVRRYDVVAADDTMQNNWNYISNPNNPTYDMVKVGECWYWTNTVTAEDWKEAKEQMDNGDFRWASSIVCNGFDPDKIMAKGKQTKRTRAKVSFGIADYHYDYEF